MLGVLLGVCQYVRGCVIALGASEELTVGCENCGEDRLCFFESHDGPSEKCLYKRTVTVVKCACIFIMLNLFHLELWGE